ncbi:hypothetical protein ACLOJK_020935 [Asimina triloba]
MLHSTPLRTSALQCGGASAKYSFSCRAKGLSVSPRRRIRVSLCLNSSQRSPAEQAHSSTSMAAILATATTTAVGASDTTAAASRLSPSYRQLAASYTSTTDGFNVPMEILILPRVLPDTLVGGGGGISGLAAGASPAWVLPGLAALGSPLWCTGLAFLGLSPLSRHCHHP